MLLTRSADSTMDFDLDLAKEQSSENPVYYVQYAHARIASILRKAAAEGFGEARAATSSLLVTPGDLALIRKMLELPEVIAKCAADLAPHHLTHYAQDLAATFHAFYRDCRVVSSLPEDAEMTQARLQAGPRGQDRPGAHAAPDGDERAGKHVNCQISNVKWRRKRRL